MKFSKYHITLLSLVFFNIQSLVLAQGVSQSKHNLSATGKGIIKTMDDTRVCIFCHTSHSSDPKAPMWNRRSSGSIYTLYNSSTLDAKPGQPDGTSILCLSCHDGMVAMGNTYKNSNSMSFANSMTKKGNLGTDLSDDHPISFEYSYNLSLKDGQLKSPDNIPSSALDENMKLQCTSCHDPHKDINENFLTRTIEYSDLCADCHNQEYWSSSVHKNSLKTWNGQLPDPWIHMDNSYNNVSQNACANCHDMHNAESPERLLKKENEEDICLDCHNGNVTEKNIQILLTKPYKHDVYSYTAIHDLNENGNTLTKHVECVDCHNPHASNYEDSSPPFVKGSIRGVKGKDKNGIETDVAIFEYEICFKCHSDSGFAQEKTLRYLGSSNIRLDFLENNISFHPVVAKGKNKNPLGLIAPFNSDSQIYCSSCHGSEDENAASGPHGSIYPRILKANYNLDKTPLLGKSWPISIQSNFTLCFECHNVNEVSNLHMDIANGHFMEIIGCNTCHDPHGYEGGSLSENGYLINFDQNIIKPNPINGRMIDLDNRKCFMTCHDPNGIVNFTHSAEGDDY